MPPPPVILLPPSEGKADGGDGAPVEWEGGTFGDLGADRLAVRDSVRRIIRARADAEKLFGVKGAHLERALVEWRDLDDAPTLPAGLRYSGVVWGALDVAGMTAPGRRRAMSRAVVPSGLWGVVAASDPVPAYRLKMGARVGAFGALSAWWRPRVSSLVARRARRGAVIDLLPREHAAAFDPAAFPPGSLVRVEIVEDGPGGRRSVGHAGKSLKGLLARVILEEDARTAADVADLAVPGLGHGVMETGKVTAVVFQRSG